MTDRDDGQMIYYVGVKIAYKVKKGNGYINHYRTMEFPTRMKTIDDMNRQPEMIMNLMAALKLTSKKIYDFHVYEELHRKELSESFTHKEKDYLKEKE
jgi:hypothetical protein